MVVLEIDVHPGGRSHCCSFPQYGLYRESIKNKNGRFNGHTMAANDLPCLMASFYRNRKVDALSQILREGQLQLVAVLPDAGFYRTNREGSEVILKSTGYSSNRTVEGHNNLAKPDSFMPDNGESRFVL